jgi:hypothetical protein
VVDGGIIELLDCGPMANIQLDLAPHLGIHFEVGPLIRVVKIKNTLVHMEGLNLVGIGRNIHGITEINVKLIRTDLKIHLAPLPHIASVFKRKLRVLVFARISNISSSCSITFLFR